MDKPLKVLILCNDFPPFNSVAARRPYSWLKYFKNYAIDPVVITKYWPDSSVSLDDLMAQVKAVQPYQTTIEETSNGTIIRVQNDLALYEELLLNHKGLVWTMIRKVVTMVWRFFAFIIPYCDKHWNLYREAERFASKNHVDVVITTGEPFILFKYGYLLKKKCNIKWVADYRDGWFLHHGTRFSKSPVVWFWRQWEKLFEKKYVSKADVITAAFPELREELQQFLNKQVHLIINGYEELIEKNDIKPGLPLTMTLGGNVTIGQKHDLFLEAIYKLKQEKRIQAGDLLVQFIGGAFDPKQKALVHPYTELLPEFLLMTPRVPIAEARQICADSDYLLLFLIPDYKHVPSKLFEYLSLQRPILVIPNDNDVVQEIITNTKTGIFCSDVMVIKQFIMAQVNHKKGGNSLPATGITPELAFKYSRHYQAGLLADIVKAL